MEKYVKLFHADNLPTWCELLHGLIFQEETFMNFFSTSVERDEHAFFLLGAKNKNVAKRNFSYIYIYICGPKHICLASWLSLSLYHIYIYIHICANYLEIWFPRNLTQIVKRASRKEDTFGIDSREFWLKSRILSCRKASRSGGTWCNCIRLKRSKRSQKAKKWQPHGSKNLWFTRPKVKLLQMVQPRKSRRLWVWRSIAAQIQYLELRESIKTIWRYLPECIRS